MPYLAFGTVPEMVLSEMAEMPDHTLEFQSMNADEQLINAYGKDVHISQTLDELYYSSSSLKTAERNRNQIVTQYINPETKTLKMSGKDNEIEVLKQNGARKSPNGKNRGQSRSDLQILRVEQLWIWVVDESMKVKPF